MCVLPGLGGGEGGRGGRPSFLPRPSTLAGTRALTESRAGSEPEAGGGAEVKWGRLTGPAADLGSDSEDEEEECLLRGSPALLDIHSLIWIMRMHSD